MRACSDCSSAATARRWSRSRESVRWRLHDLDAIAADRVQHARVVGVRAVEQRELLQHLTEVVRLERRFQRIGHRALVGADQRRAERLLGVHEVDARGGQYLLVLADAVLGLREPQARAVRALDDTLEALPIALDLRPRPIGLRAHVGDAACLSRSRRGQAGGADAEHGRGLPGMRPRRFMISRRRRSGRAGPIARGAGRLLRQSWAPRIAHGSRPELPRGQVVITRAPARSCRRACARPYRRARRPRRAARTFCRWARG